MKNQETLENKDIYFENNYDFDAKEFSQSDIDCEIDYMLTNSDHVESALESIDNTDDVTRFKFITLLTTSKVAEIVQTLISLLVKFKEAPLIDFTDVITSLKHDNEIKLFMRDFMIKQAIRNLENREFWK